MFEQELIGQDYVFKIKRGIRAGAHAFCNYSMLGPEKRRNMVRNLYIIGKGEFEITIKSVINAGGNATNPAEEEDIDPA